MSAPSCIVVLRDRWIKDQVGELESWLTKFGSVSPFLEDQGLQVLSPPVAPSDELENESGPGLVVSLKDPGEPYQATFVARIVRSLSWSPGQFIDVGAFNSAPESHAFVGRVALELAERYKGLIHLTTICTLEDSAEEGNITPEVERLLDDSLTNVPPADRTPEGMFRHLMRRNPMLEPLGNALGRWYDARVRKRIASLPGKVFELPGHEESTSYLVDATFMRTWLEDPNFRIE